MVGGRFLQDLPEEILAPLGCATPWFGQPPSSGRVSLLCGSAHAHALGSPSLERIPQSAGICWGVSRCRLAPELVTPFGLFERRAALTGIIPRLWGSWCRLCGRLRDTVLSLRALVKSASCKGRALRNRSPPERLSACPIISRNDALRVLPQPTVALSTLPWDQARFQPCGVTLPWCPLRLPAASVRRG